MTHLCLVFAMSGAPAYAQSAGDPAVGGTPDATAADPAAEYTGDPDGPDSSGNTGPGKGDGASNGNGDPDDPPDGGKKSKRALDVDMRGRVFVRNTIESEGWTSVLAVDSARLGARYRKRGLQIEVEGEFAGGRASLRDGYVRIDASDSIRVKLGRFKRPISAVALSSKWDLPVLERGVVSDLELIPPNTAEPSRLPLGGRADGIAVEWRGKFLSRKTRATIGLFRSDVHKQIEDTSVNENRTPLSLSDGFHEDLYARAEFEAIEDLQVGLSVAGVGYLSTAATPDTFRFGVVGGVDAVYQIKSVRVWLEGYVGKSTLHFGANQHARGLFFAVRTIAAWRLPFKVPWFRYVEPYAGFQTLTGSTDFNDVGARQITGGVNAGLGKSYRVGLSVDSLGVDNQLTVVDGLQIAAQLGAVF